MMQYKEKQIQAETLPDGWIWHHSRDGSGALYSPEGDRYFFYDRSRYSVQGWIQYVEDKNSRSFKIFHGSFEKFVRCSENYVKEHVLEADRDER